MSNRGKKAVKKRDNSTIITDAKQKKLELFINDD